MWRFIDAERLSLVFRFVITLIVILGAGAELHFNQSNADLSGGLLAILGLVLGYWFGRSGEIR
jgi:Na+/alanine symporter